MRTLSTSLALLSIALGACARATPAPAPVTVSDVARVDAGVLHGAVQDGIASFKGIPFAAPPVGALRWRAPQPVAAWTGERDATRYGALCMQKYNPQDNGVGALPMSEDCLTLNVWSPAGAHAPLPVMVWIHGGGYVNGSGTAALYDGTALAKQGVVVVTINYRLGRFGFFAHPALTREHADRALGNYGLMDQIAALDWVRRNAAAFGGDPRDVTIFGESAGGGSVLRLMISPPARGLFTKAIVESGLGRDVSAYLSRATPSGIPSAEAMGKSFTDSLGVVTTDDAAALRAIPAERIMAAGDPSLWGGGGPIVDGVTVTMQVDEAFARGAQAKVPLIVGTNSDEFPGVPETSGMFRSVVTLTPAERARAEAAYGGHAAFVHSIVSDMIFTEPARFVAREQAGAGEPVYLYRFSVLSPSMRGRLQGAPHASERQYVFQTLGTSPWPTAASDTAAAKVMSAYWAAFARTGDPNGDDRPHWPRFTVRGDSLLDFTNDGPVARTIPDAARLDVISAHYDVP